MKYFIDTAVQSEIDEWASFVEGPTSNPSLLGELNRDILDRKSIV